MSTITYRTDIIPETSMVIEVYESSGINRPTADKERISEMYNNSDLIVTAWDGQKLVGVSRSLTDFCYCCYLSDLAVSSSYQKLGIGKKLIDITKEKVGDKTTLILVSAPTAVDFYCKIGLDKIESAFMIKRIK